MRIQMNNGAFLHHVTVNPIPGGTMPNLVSAQEIADRLNAMEDGDVLAVVKQSDNEFEIIDLDQDPKGKHTTIDLEQDPREADHVHNRNGANFGCTICWDKEHGR
jgi:hypothetical protein